MIKTRHGKGKSKVEQEKEQGKHYQDAWASWMIKTMTLLRSFHALRRMVPTSILSLTESLTGFRTTFLVDLHNSGLTRSALSH